MSMTNRERFKAVANFEEADYIPIFSFSGAPGMGGGCMEKTHDHLVQTGMPAHIGGRGRLGSGVDAVESWRRYWGTTGPIKLGFSIASGAEGFRTSRRIEDGFEIIESENGAITRQVIDNDITYIMPEYVRYPVRDRESWEFYKSRTTPTSFMSSEEIEERCRILDARTEPLEIHGSGTYGSMRGLMGPENLSLTLYDDPELIHDIADTILRNARRVLPLVERLRPEIFAWGEDLCYNHGMLLSPEHFHEFCGPIYQEQCDCARSNGVDMIAVDTDGNINEYTGVAESYGVNAIYPCEVKAGNDLFTLRENHPRFIFMGGLEKESINEGNEDSIEPEILGKVPALLDKRGYFPNGDHGIQPMATFPNLHKFMTILHEVCRNPEGDFLRS
jgi:hypothetical protein